MSSTPEEKINLQRRRWAVIAAKGKTRWVIVRGALGFGLGMTVLTFLWEHVSSHMIADL
jgi:hypothetical protein